MNLKNKYKVIISVFLLAVTFWLATPKSYIHGLLNHHHSLPSFNIEGKTTINDKNSDDCEINKYNPPAHFNLFNFINEFIPFKPQNFLYHSIISSKAISFSITLPSLRAPPELV
ncbi:MAG: hypothetical protein JSU07_08750 [Bacteroidetes bacterium]|nr:hypothetical protein [Bacteroidota bacterium]